jgi:beta-mannosidase
VGGFYENQEFYNLCDSLGLMVWQDFMYACSMYPGDKDFLDNITEEAIQNVKRLRHHPSIALWCGNNEIETAWGINGDPGWGWRKEYTPEQENALAKAYDTIFHAILPNAVANCHPEAFYWPSSPTPGFNEPAGNEYGSGDVHYWGVWHGKEEFDRFNKLIPRFMSEYGFQSFPVFQSVIKYTDSTDWDIESEVMTSHQRSGIGNLRIKEYMSWDYNIPSDFEHFLYIGQLLQAEGMKTAIEAHRRNKPYCMGSLYWQLNDCWPAASWSSIDYYGRWKAVQYAVKKAFEPLSVMAYNSNNQIEIWVASDKLTPIEATLQYKLLSFDGKLLFEKEQAFSIDKNQSMCVTKIPFDEISKHGDVNYCVLELGVLVSDSVLANNVFYFNKVKNLKLPDASPEISINASGQLSIKSNVLLKNLFLFTDDEATFSDNFFDVLPGQTHIITIKGPKAVMYDKTDIKWVSVADTY